MLNDLVYESGRQLLVDCCGQDWGVRGVGPTFPRCSYVTSPRSAPAPHYLQISEAIQLAVCQLNRYAAIDQVYFQDFQCFVNSTLS